MIDLSTFLALTELPLADFAPKPTSIEGDQVEATHTLWTSPDGRLEIGIWECTPGRFTADRSQAAEFCHFLSGAVEMRHHDGRVQRLGAGDALMLPKGWKGEWVLTQRTRKIYAFYRD
jgi:uncharacterized cupin superfamily protein